MNMYSITRLIILAMLTITRAENEDIACCAPRKYLLQQKCWTPGSNITEPIRLSCAKYIKTFKFTISSEGNVELSSTIPQSVGPDMACVGNVSYQNSTRKVALLCQIEEEPRVISDMVLGGCMIVSVIFFTLIAIIYAALGEIRDLQGKSIINLCGSLAIGFSMLSILKLMEYSDMKLCALRGFLTYFFIMAAFFWTSAISLQIMLSTRKPLIVDHGWKEFGWYALYAWGCPTVLTIIMAIVNFHPGNHAKPGIGLSHCWFLYKEQQWYYMYSVITLILCVNIFIFVYTSTIVCRLSFSSNHTRALRYRLTMMIRLVIVMGLLWVFEMIGSLMESHIVWEILDVVNLLQGPLMFLVLVVFRKRVVKAMLQHGWLECISGPVEKYLAAGSDCEDNVVQHTDIPMNDP